MFETRLQTYRADVDAARIVYYLNFFKFVEHAEGTRRGIRVPAAI